MTQPHGRSLPGTDGRKRAQALSASRLSPDKDVLTGPLTPETRLALEDALDRSAPQLDWDKLWHEEKLTDWLVEPFLPARRLVSLYSVAKLGKSLFALDVAAGLTQGRNVLTDEAIPPRSVLYLDFENDPQGDVRSRLSAMGHGPPDLEGLHYLSFPNIDPLDTDAGGKTLIRLAKRHQAELIVVDTLSRVISGEENSNDTWLHFYRYTGMRIKENGLTLLRLDHAGKDAGKGQRGGSAKSADVDAVWRMSKAPRPKLRLDLEASRLPMPIQTLTVDRETAPLLRHRLDPVSAAQTEADRLDGIVAIMDAAGLQIEAGRDAARQVLKSAGASASNKVLTDAVARRKRGIAADGQGAR